MDKKQGHRELLEADLSTWQNRFAAICNDWVWRAFGSQQWGTYYPGYSDKKIIIEFLPIGMSFIRFIRYTPNNNSTVHSAEKETK